jgi:L-aspartate oxidase
MRASRAEFDFIIVGAGIAGLRAAIAAAPAGRVLVLAKNEITESATQYAQGGIAAALSDDDEVSLHLQDTLTAGDGLCNVAAATVLVEEGPERIEELIAWGTDFDRKGTKLTFTREGAHSRNRVLHAHGDSTGREIARALWEKARSIEAITIQEFAFTTDLLLHDGHVYGVWLIDQQGGHLPITARAVLIATGGLGQVFRDTTNPGLATGDGAAMAFRAGAELSDMEFVQFHPTALYLKGAPRFLISEALRGEGGHLLNAEMVRFMPKYHPLAELAPRDVVARAIAHELDISAAHDPAVYLDMTHLHSRERLDQRFPRVYSTCLQFNVDIRTDLIPVRPAAHYSMGGVRTDLEGRSSLPGLFAAGEAACAGVHGANRLASNSLLEGLVFGTRAGEAMAQSPVTSRQSPEAVASRQSFVASNGDADGTWNAKSTAAEIQQLMWKHAGIVRSGSGLRNVIARLEQLGDNMPVGNSRHSCETRNLQQAALLIARSALAREESRGAHYRSDFPVHDDAKFRKHSVLRDEAIWFE